MIGIAWRPAVEASRVALSRRRSARCRRRRGPGRRVRVASFRRDAPRCRRRRSGLGRGTARPVACRPGTRSSSRCHADVHPLAVMPVDGDRMVRPRSPATGRLADPVDQARRRSAGRTSAPRSCSPRSARRPAYVPVQLDVVDRRRPCRLRVVGRGRQAERSGQSAEFAQPPERCRSGRRSRAPMRARPASSRGVMYWDGYVPASRSPEAAVFRRSCRPRPPVAGDRAPPCRAVVVVAAIVRIRPLGATDQEYRPMSPVEHGPLPAPVVSSWN